MEPVGGKRNKFRSTLFFPGDDKIVKQKRSRTVACALNIDKRSAVPETSMQHPVKPGAPGHRLFRPTAVFTLLRFASRSRIVSARQSAPSSTAGRNLIIILAVGLAILHQDFWLWDNPTLIFGFMPIGLAYHAMYSIAAACLWALAIKIAWPHHLEALAEETGESDH
jgi:hypothetical protein